MEFNFRTVLGQLTSDEIRTLSRQADPTKTYLMNSLLPDREVPSYKASGGNFSVTGTLASPVPMDTDFPEAGIMGIQTIEQSTFKFGASLLMPEKVLRELQEMLKQMLSEGRSEGDKQRLMAGTAVNFFREYVINPFDETREYLKARAITEGLISYSSNKVEVAADYGVPVGNILATRAGVAAYNGNASVFLDDIKTARQKLGQDVRATLMNGDTLDSILNNPLHNFIVVAESYSPDRTVRTVNVRQAVKLTGQTGVSALDITPQSSYTFIGYSRTAKLFNPDDPNTPIAKKLIDDGRVVVIGNRLSTEIIPRLNNDGGNTLGYYHVAPTVEGNGALGRWAEIYVPQEMPWSIRARAAENSIPMFDAASRVVLLKSATI